MSDRHWNAFAQICLLLHVFSSAISLTSEKERGVLSFFTENNAGQKSRLHAPLKWSVTNNKIDMKGERRRRQEAARAASDRCSILSAIA